MKTKFIIFLQILIGLFFLIPIVFLSYSFFDIKILDFDGIQKYFLNSFLQSSISAVTVLVFGFVMSLGLFRFNQKWAAHLIKLCFTPVLIPSLISVMIALQMMSPFPFGHIGVILVFNLVYLGFAASSFYLAIHQNLSSYINTAEIYSIKKFDIILKIILPNIKRQILFIGLIVFLGCFSSFTIPFMLGGKTGGNLEVFIYEKIYIQQDWSTVVVTALIQILMLYSLSYCLKVFNQNYRLETFNQKKIASNIGAAMIIFYLTAYFGTFIFHILDVKTLSRIGTFLNADYLLILLNTVIFYFFIVIGFSILFSIYAYLIYKKKNVQWLTTFASPSIGLTGFFIFLFFASTQNIWIEVSKVGYLFLVSYFVALVLNFLSNDLFNLQKSMKIARIYQIRFPAYLLKIIIPTLKKNIVSLLSFSFLICFFEFSVFKVSGSPIKTTGVIIYEFLSSYRTDYAYALSALVILVWILIFSLTFSLSEKIDVLFKKHKLPRR